MLPSTPMASGSSLGLSAWFGGLVSGLKTVVFGD